MSSVFTITKAKARFSEIVSRLIQIRETVVITKKGRTVAVLMPFETYRDLKKPEGRGLLEARQALADLDREVDDLCSVVYGARDKAKGRRAPL
jgi:prevent-host-death family protein